MPIQLNHSRKDCLGEHAHATILLERGVNPKLVLGRLDHASVATTTDIYSDVLPDMQEKQPWR